jgi:hypothetical protein
LQEYLVNYDVIETFTVYLVNEISRMQISRTWMTLNLAMRHSLLAIQHVGKAAISLRLKAEEASGRSNYLGERQRVKVEMA